MKTHHIYDQYISHMTEIRSLSTPWLDGIRCAEDYSTRLRENFIRIGILASENRKILDSVLFPILRSDENLSEKETGDMDAFVEKMLDPEGLENVDPVITFKVEERLLKDALIKGKFLSMIHEMDVWLSTLYTLMNITGRITEYPEIINEFRQKGFELGAYFLSLRQKDRFAAIPDEESRELVLTSSRFISAFYENLCGDPNENSYDLSLLEDSLAICDDPFYFPLVPNYDWDCYRIRSFHTMRLRLISITQEDLMTNSFL